jgi:hypothetical protein
MNLEIMEFYPLERDEAKGLLTGTLRIRLPELGLHILGVYVSRRKDNWFFSMPGRRGTHHNTSENIFYPFIVFEERERMRLLMESIREKGRAFIEERLSDTERPLIFAATKPKEKQQQKPQQKAAKSTIEPKVQLCAEIATKAEETASIANPAPLIALASKQWSDPPPRKGLARSASKFAKR